MCRGVVCLAHWVRTVIGGSLRMSGTFEVRGVHSPPTWQALQCDYCTYVHRDDDAQYIVQLYTELSPHITFLFQVSAGCRDGREQNFMVWTHLRRSDGCCCKHTLTPSTAWGNIHTHIQHFSITSADLARLSLTCFSITTRLPAWRFLFNWWGAPLLCATCQHYDYNSCSCSYKNRYIAVSFIMTLGFVQILV